MSKSPEEKCHRLLSLSLQFEEAWKEIEAINLEPFSFESNLITLSLKDQATIKAIAKSLDLNQESFFCDIETILQDAGYSWKFFEAEIFSFAFCYRRSPKSKEELFRYISSLDDD